MKLRDCLETGWICGLEEVGEAINNVLLHDQNLFSYENLGKEEKELFDEINTFQVMDDEKIKDVLLRLFNVNTADVDKKLQENLNEINCHSPIPE